MTRRPLIGLLLLTLGLPIVAAERSGPTEERKIFTPARPLTDEGRQALRSRGIEIERPLTDGRFIARVRGNGDELAALGTLRDLSIDEKVHASAWRAAAEARPFGQFRVFFHHGVSFDEARAAIGAAGGETEDVLTAGFEPLQSVRVRVPTAALQKLAEDERILVVYGRRAIRAQTDNAAAATLVKNSLIQAAPYGLTGAGVVLSFFELAAPDTAHQEFGGRFTVNFTCTPTDSGCNNNDSKIHATHVAGTMIASGVDSSVKGMAPAATLQMYRGNRGSWLDQKETALKSIGSVADNNSWGYVLGWTGGDSGGWVWTEGEELIGGYTGDLNAVLDHVARLNGTLMVHSAGNDAGDAGPSVPPYRHHHVDDEGDDRPEWWCYSANKSGTDCPADVCTAGAEFCEKTPHPEHSAKVDNPGGSIGWMASSKNIVAVGSTTSQKIISGFSSRGPTKDGRVKPDLTAKGQSLRSTSLGNTYATLQGTSMAAPVVTGTMALLAEQWRKLNAGASPLPVTLKAVAIAGSEDLGHPGPDYTYGFGFLDAKAAADIIIADAGSGKRVRIDSATQGSTFDYPVEVTSAGNLRVVLSWFDPEVLPLGSEEVAAKTLVNDLDLRVVDPAGNTTQAYVLNPSAPGTPATRGVNTIDNTEVVQIANATPGTYHVIVTGTTVPQGPQQFVAVASSNFNVAAPCTDLAEPNETTSAAYGVTRGQSVSAVLCSSSDVDHYRFLVSKTAPSSSSDVTVSVTATGTPLRLTLLRNGTQVGSPLEVAANTTGTVIDIAPVGLTTYLVRIESAGALGAAGDYTLTVQFPQAVTPRTRATRR